MSAKTSTAVVWNGPYGWPDFECDLPPVPHLPGVYLLTVNYQKGFLIYGVGITRRPIPQRLREHTHLYFKGRYNVYDFKALRKGKRVVVWKWMGLGDISPSAQARFNKHRVDVTIDVCKLLAGCRVFTANIGTVPRILERLEAAIIVNLHEKQPAPFCTIPDSGMHLEGRWDSEKPIVITNKCAVLLHGLPNRLEI